MKRRYLEEEFENNDSRQPVTGSLSRNEQVVNSKAFRHNRDLYRKVAISYCHRKNIALTAGDPWHCATTDYFIENSVNGKKSKAKSCCVQYAVKVKLYFSAAQLN